MVEISINKIPLGHGVKVCSSTKMRLNSHGSQSIEGFNIEVEQRYSVGTQSTST